MPCFSIFGWQKPCYLIQEGYADSYKELTESVDWSGYGAGSGNPKCANCMVSCGYEWTSVVDGFSSLKGFWEWCGARFSNYPDAHALASLDEPYLTDLPCWFKSRLRFTSSRRHLHDGRSPQVHARAVLNRWN